MNLQFFGGRGSGSGGGGKVDYEIEQYNMSSIDSEKEYATPIVATWDIKKQMGLAGRSQYEFEYYDSKGAVRYDRNGKFAGFDHYAAGDDAWTAIKNQEIYKSFPDEIKLAYARRYIPLVIRTGVNWKKEQAKEAARLEKLERRNARLAAKNAKGKK